MIETKHSYHVIRTDHGRRELRDGLKLVGDLTASPAVAEALLEILFERSALLEAMKRIHDDPHTTCRCGDIARAAIAEAEGAEGRKEQARAELWEIASGKKLISEESYRALGGADAIRASAKS